VVHERIGSAADEEQLALSFDEYIRGSADADEEPQRSVNFARRNVKTFRSDGPGVGSAVIAVGHRPAVPQ